MAILPTKFIARIPQYPQDAEYGQWCADTSRQLIEQLKENADTDQKKGLDDINDFFVPKLQYFFLDRINERRADGVKKGVALDGPIRQHSTHTPLNNSGIKYMRYAREALLAHAEELGSIHDSASQSAVRIVLDDREPPILLTEITRSGPPPQADALERHVKHMRHPSSIGQVDLWHSVTPNKPEYEAAKNAFNEALNEALGTKPLTHSSSREEAALKSYYLYSHIMPFPGHSSSAARVLLEGLAEITGLKTYHLAENYDINLEALVRNWGDFKQAHQRGTFWA